jgi:hypothetical protein
VEGKVTLDGQPLANASVVFIPENGRPAGGRTDTEGKYFLIYAEGRRGTIPGKNRVRIMTQTDPYETASGEKVPAQKERVPMRYNTQTELSFDVQPRTKNVADFALESGGPIATGDEYN